MDERYEVEDEPCIECYQSIQKDEVDFAAIGESEQSSESNHIEPIDREVSLIEKKVSKDEDSNVDDDFAFLYYTIAGNDERLDAFELQKIMAMIFRKKFPKNSDFSLETCRSMVASMDEFKIGKLNYSQFKKLWSKILRWSYTFNQSEKNEDGKIDFAELRIGFNKLKVNLKENTLRRIMYKFQNKQQLIELDDFIQICCKAESAKVSFQKVEDGNANFELFLTEIMLS